MDNLITPTVFRTTGSSKRIVNESGLFPPRCGKATEHLSGRRPMMFVQHMQAFGSLASIFVVLWSADAKTHRSFATLRSRSLIDQIPRLHRPRDVRDATRYSCRAMSGYDVSAFAQGAVLDHFHILCKYSPSSPLPCTGSVWFSWADITKAARLMSSKTAGPGGCASHFRRIGPSGVLISVASCVLHTELVSVAPSTRTTRPLPQARPLNHSIL